MNYVLSAIIGYMFGCVNMAYVCGKLNGFDIRERGTGNAGASNAKVVLGWKYFFIVAFYDAFKAVFGILAVKYFLHGSMEMQVLAGVFAILGHCFPFYMNFKGGKGFASLIGLTFMMNWKFCFILLAVAVLLSVLLNYIVVATAMFTFAFPIYCLCTHQSTLIIVLSLINTAIMIYQHRINIQKFFCKEEVGINGKPVGILLKK